MSLVVGYEEKVVTQIFQRDLGLLVRPEVESLDGIYRREVKYLAEQLAASCVMGLSENWFKTSGAQDLVHLSPEKATEAEFQHCEWTANNILLLESVVMRSSSVESLAFNRWETTKAKLTIAENLYKIAAFGASNAGQKLVLEALASDTFSWAALLSYMQAKTQKNLFTSLNAGPTLQ